MFLLNVIIPRNHPRNHPRYHPRNHPHNHPHHNNILEDRRIHKDCCIDHFQIYDHQQKHLSLYRCFPALLQ